MAQNPAFIMVALLLIAAATPLAHGQLLNNGNFTGQFCCTSSGNCTTGSVGIPGVVVTLNCTNTTGSVVTLGQAVTNATGGFTILSSSLLGLGPAVSGLLPCEALVILPLNGTVCPILGAVTGIIGAVPLLINTVSSLLELFGFFNFTAFVKLGA